MPHVFRRNRRNHVLLALALAPLGASAFAATDTWAPPATPLSNNWNDPSNWGGTAPSPNDILQFAGTNNLNTNNNFPSLTQFDGITFTSNAGAFTLGGAGITLGLTTAGGANTATAGDIVNNSSASQTINLAGITLQPGAHLFSTGVRPGVGGSLNISSNITQTPGSSAVFNTVNGHINFTGSNLANDSSANGGLLGGWAMIGGTNTVPAGFATLDVNKNVVAYTGYFNILGNGTLPNDPTQNVAIIGNAAGQATTQALPATVTTINTLLFAATNATTTAAAQTVAVGAGNTLVLGQNGGIMNATGTGGGTLRNLTVAGGTLTAGDGIHPANITFSSGAVPNVSGYLTISSNITDNGSAPVSVTINGGYVTETGTGNSYSGGTYIVAGRVSQALASTFGTGPVYIYPGAQTNTNANITNNFFIAGNGSLEQPGLGLGAIRLFGAPVFSGNITLMADAMVAPTNTSTPTFTGQITGTGNFTIGRTNGSQGGGVLSIGSNTGTGFKNNYTGDTTIAGPTGGGNANTTLAIVAPTSAGANDNIMPHGLTGSFSNGPTGNLILDASPGSGTHLATFDLNGTTQTINGLSSSSAAPANNFITSGGGSGLPGLLIIGDSNASGNFGGIIMDGASQLGITKIGAGTQVFTGANTYSGDTNVNGGTLVSTNALNASANLKINSAAASATFAGAGTVGNIILAANTGSNTANLAPGTSAAPGVIGTLNAASLTVNGGNLLVDLGTSGTSDLVNVGGLVHFAGAANIVPNAGVAGVYTILSSSQPIAYDVPVTLSVPAHDPLTRATNYTLDTTSDPTKIQIDVTGGAKAITWTGAGGSTWDINSASAKNWVDTTLAPEVFFNNDFVTFGDGAANRTITVSGTVTPGSVTVNNSPGNDYTFGGGTIGGAASLTKSNGGNLTLAANNTYSGGTTISGGTVFVGNGGTAGSFGSGPVNNGGTLVFARTDAVSIPNIISGSGTVAIGQTGVAANVTLAGANTYTGATTVTNGSTLTIGPVGSIAASSGTTLDNGTEIINGPSSASNFGTTLVIGPGGGTVKYGSAALNAFNTNIGVSIATGATLTIDINDPTSSIKTYTNANVFTGAGDLVVTNSQGVPGTAIGGLDTYVLSANNSAETGNLSVTGPVRLEANNANALPAGTVTVADGAQLFFNVANTFANNFNISGAGTQTDEPSLGALRLANGSTLTGTITLAGTATLTAGTSAANTATLNGQITGAGALTLASGTFALTNTTPNASTYGPTAPGSVATIIGSVSGRPAIVTVNNAGSISNGGLQFQGGTLHINGFSLSVPNLSSTAAGGTIDNVGGGPITLSFGSDNTSQSSSAVIADGSAPVSIVKNGTGTQTLGGANTFSGGATVSSGTLIAANPQAFGRGALSVHAGATARLQPGLPAGTSLAGLQLDGATGAWTGTLDIANNKVAVEDAVTHAATFAQLQNQVNFGKTHAGGGITSSTGLAANYGIAVLDNATFNKGSFGGTTVDANAILVGPELLGDANVDGTVDANDLNIILSHFGAASAAWTDGNFDGHATINLTDLADVLNNFGQNNPAPFATGTTSIGAITATPEPASLAALGIGALALALRRRRL